MALPRRASPFVAPPKVAATCLLVDVRVAEDKNIEERLSDDLGLVEVDAIVAPEGTPVILEKAVGHAPS